MHTQKRWQHRKKKHSRLCRVKAHNEDMLISDEMQSDAINNNGWTLSTEDELLQMLLANHAPLGPAHFESISKKHFILGCAVDGRVKE